jgi:hypothetical protein
MRGCKRILLIEGMLGVVLVLGSTGCGEASDKVGSGSEASGTGDGSAGSSSGSTSSETDENAAVEDVGSAGGTEGPCGQEDACRTAEDCGPGQLCVDCSCCDPEVGGLACGDRPPPGGTRCEDEPGTMFLCPSPYVCCGSKELCYDPTREPDFCPDG